MYAATKVHGEQLAPSGAARPAAEAAALRFHNVYGPGMPRDTPYAGVASLFRASLEQGQPPQVFEDGRQRRNFVHVDDVAQAVLRAAGRRSARRCHGSKHRLADVSHHRRDGRDAGRRTLHGPAPVVTGRYRLGDVRHITADCTAAETSSAGGPRSPSPTASPVCFSEPSGEPPG